MAQAAETIIQEAMQRGEFNNLSGSGKPLDLTDYFNMPEDIRMAYSILKSAGVLPKEVELLREIATLKSQLEYCSDEQKHLRLTNEIDERMLKFNVLMEQQKSQRRKMRR